jgi:hypothetical protein
MNLVAGADLPACRVLREDSALIAFRYRASACAFTKRLRTAVYSLPLGRRRQSVNGKPSIRMRLASAARHHIFNHAQVKNH